MLPKITPKSGATKLLPKAVPQNTCKVVTPKLQSFKPIPRNRCPTLFSKVAAKSCSAKLLPKAAPKNLVLKLIPKAAVFQRFCATLCRKGAPASQSCSPKLLKLPPKVASGKQLPKVAVYSNSPKLSSFTAIVRPCCCKVAPHSCFPMLFSKVATKSHIPNKLPKTARTE